MLNIAWRISCCFWALWALGCIGSSGRLVGRNSWCISPKSELMVPTYANKYENITFSIWILFNGPNTFVCLFPIDISIRNYKHPCSTCEELPTIYTNDLPVSLSPCLRLCLCLSVCLPVCTPRSRWEQNLSTFQLVQFSSTACGASCGQRNISS